MTDPKHCYLLVKIHRATQPEERGRYLRAPIFDAKEVHLKNATDAVVLCNSIPQGKTVMHELIKVQVLLAEKYVAAYPDRFAILTEYEATGIMKWCHKLAGRDMDAELVNDERRLQVITTKLKAQELGYAIKLSEKDLAALDPDDAEPGLTRLPKTAQDFFLGEKVNAADLSKENRKAQRKRANARKQEHGTEEPF